MTIKDIVGIYSIIGTNQDSEKNTYKGTLTLTLDTNNRIIAKWLINEVQQQYGTGFFNNNILVINFNYQGDNLKIYKGTVVYKCLTKNILDGFWSEQHGNPFFLGEEQCFRIKEKEHLN